MATHVGPAGRFWRPLVVVALVTTITAPVVFLARPVSADTASDLQAKATQLSQEILREQLQIGAYTQQYEASTQKVQADAQQIAQTEQKVVADERRTALDRSQLQIDAVSLYTEYGSAATATPLFQSADAVQRQREYLGVAFGDTSVAIDQLNLARSTLEDDRSSLQHQQQADQALQAQAAGLLQQAQSSQNALAAEQAQVNGQLATVIAQQQAAAEAAAAARQAAASQAAATQVSTSGSSGATPPTGSGSSAGAGGSASGGATSDPALPPFLVCVRQVESGGNYQAVSPNGEYMGAFQFSQPTWNDAAQLAGLPGLVGVPPNTATKADQDTLAVALYNADGDQPWYGDCGS